MKVYTSYFGNLKNLTAAGVVPVAISRYPPKWFSGYRIMELAPTGDMLRMSRSVYTTKFNAILDKTTPHKILAQLKDISKVNEGKPVALCCFEALKTPGEWCHRTMVADWMIGAGILVTEFGAVPKSAGLFDQVTEDI